MNCKLYRYDNYIIMCALALCNAKQLLDTEKMGF